MGRPYAVQANFDPQLVITSVAIQPGGIMAKPYADRCGRAVEGSIKSWSIVSGQPPAGLTPHHDREITGFRRRPVVSVSPPG
jgi:hypothetical protein